MSEPTKPPSDEPSEAKPVSASPTEAPNQSDQLGDDQEMNPMVAPSRSIRPHGTEASRVLAAAAARVALENNASDVMVIDVCKQSAEFDLFVLATGTSRRQLHAISEQIDDVLQKELGDCRMGLEGYEESRWIVLDYGSVVIHLFDDETREYYDLESLWADGTPVSLDDLGVQVD